MLSSYDVAHVQDILNGEGDWFTAQLLRLVAKADDENRNKLHLAFPEVVDAYFDWYYSTGSYAIKGGSTIYTDVPRSDPNLDQDPRQHMKNASKGHLLRS